MCVLCSAYPVNELDDPLFSEDEQNTYLEKVFAGVITINSLDTAYHEKHSLFLYEPTIENIGNPLELEGEVIRQEVATSFRVNSFEFSAAKQYQQVREMSSMIDSEVNFTEFKKKADGVFGTYNDTYLKTEFDTAINITQNSNNYIDSIETMDQFPLIQYKSQNDGRVRQAHRALHGTTLPPNHPFWDNYMPPNGWACRCFTVKLTSGKETAIKDIDLKEVKKNTPELFRQNAAKTGEMFDTKKHPYFDVAKGDNDLKNNNFNLPRG